MSAPVRPRSVAKYPTFWVTVAAHKGGTGKTTLSAHLGAALHHRLRSTGATPPRVLLIDLDPQGDLTDMLGVTEDAAWWFTNAPVVTGVDEPTTFSRPLRPTLADLIRLEGRPTAQQLANALEPVEGLDGLWLLAGGWDLERVAQELLVGAGLPEGVFPEQHAAPNRIRAILDEFDQMFDAVVLDCPPGLGAFVNAALVKANLVVLPVLPDQFSFRALYETHSSIHAATMNGNPNLEIGAVVLMQQNPTNLAKTITDLLKDRWGKYLFPEAVPARTIFRELSIFERTTLRRSMLLFELGREYDAVKQVFYNLADSLLAKAPRLLGARAQAASPDNMYEPRRIVPRRDGSGLGRSGRHTSEASAAATDWPEGTPGGQHGAPSGSQAPLPTRVDLVLSTEHQAR